MEGTKNLPHTSAAAWRRLLRALRIVLPALVVVLGIVSPPWSILDKAHLVGYGVCHQIPARTFFFNNQPLPLCARCSGTYLGAVIGFIGLQIMGRRRVGELPPAGVLLVLAGFIALMGIDGLNSYLSFFPAAPQLYQPANVLRLTTGLLNGLAISLIVYPVFNFTLWQRTERRRSINKVWELAFFLPAIGIVVFAMESGYDFLLYPLAILSTSGVLILLTMVNAMIVMILTRQESMASNWGQASLFILWGVAVSFLELAAMIVFRAFMTAQWGLPF